MVHNETLIKIKVAKRRANGGILVCRQVTVREKFLRFLQILDRECAGEKQDLEVATFSYRKASHLDVADATKAIRWLKRNKYKDCFRVPEPEVAKTGVRKLIGSGVKVPGCSVVEESKYSLR